MFCKPRGNTMGRLTYYVTDGPYGSRKELVEGPKSALARLRDEEMCA